MVKSAAITGVAKARQTKADVPSRKDLRGFKFIVLAWGIGCMASVLEDELSRVPFTIEYVSGSVSNNESQSLKYGNLCNYETIHHSKHQQLQIWSTDGKQQNVLSLLQG
jgi:hypothetical protein